MSDYQVIARKWRPVLFSEIVGQNHVTRTLEGGVKSGRISHAYIFSGPRGVGKTTAARILARCLNCASGPIAVPCNTCSQCKAVINGSSTDVFEIDGASNNSVDNIREIRESVKYLPSEGKYRVYIIDEVHMLTSQAFNALLKTLEEPPAHAVFIFATTEIHKIPLTILSRCQRLDFKRITLGKIQSHLKKIVEAEGISFDDDALYTLARGGDGSLRDAQSLLEQVLAFGGGTVKSDDVSSALGLMDRSVLFDLLEAMVLKDAVNCLNLVEKIYKFGYDLKKASADLIEVVRDLNVVYVGLESGQGARELVSDLPDHEYKRLEELAAGTGAERLQMLFTIISKAYEEVSRSAFPRYTLELALVKAALFDSVRSVAAIAESLEKLSNRAIGLQNGSGGSGGDNNADMAAPASATASRLERPAEQVGVPDNSAVQEASVSVGRSGLSSEPSQPGSTAEPSESGSALFKKMNGGTVHATVAAAAGQTVAEESVAVYSGANAGNAPDGLLKQITARNPELGKLLESACIDVDGDVVKINATDKRRECKLSADRAQLESLCKSFFRREMRIEVGVGATIVEEKRGPEPLVKEALEVFGGVVLEESRRSTNV